jgi:hypothetical protein
MEPPFSFPPVERLRPHCNSTLGKLISDALAYEREGRPSAAEFRRRLLSVNTFYSCFISYSTHDQEFAKRLYADLQNNNVRCWFAPHDIQGGKKIHEQIDEAIRAYDRVLLILSDASMGSEWVKTEVANARQKEKNQSTRVLFPISLVPYETIRLWKNFDADTGKDSAREVREYYIPDFSEWENHDKYQVAFERLIQDLKAETANDDKGSG